MVIRFCVVIEFTVFTPVGLHSLGGLKGPSRMYLEVMRKIRNIKAIVQVRLAFHNVFLHLEWIRRLSSSFF